MSDSMNEQYQKCYNEVITGSLTDAVMMNISYQANIKLANGIIAEQEKTIKDLRENTNTSKKELLDNIQTLKSELENIKNSKTNSENIKITSLENTVRTLQNNINELNKLKSEYETVKHQVQHVDTFRNELVKEREAHKLTRDEYSNQIEELNAKIEYLQLTPAKRKKIDESKKVVEEPVVEQPTESFVTSDENVIVKDGGSF